MRKTLVAATAAAVLVAGQLPAQAAGPEAPTEVEIGWATTPGKIQVRWKDGGQANRIRVQVQSTLKTEELATTTAAEANEVLIDSGSYGLFSWEVLRITVVATDAAGESAPGNSPWFDAILTQQPKLIDAGPTADLSLLTVWTNTAVPEDTTPNDPLDRPASEAVVGPEIWYGWGQSHLVEAFWHPAGTTSALVPPRPRPYPVKIASRTEWGQPRSNRWIIFGLMNVGITLPATAVYGKPITVGGSAGILDCITGTPPCQPHTGPNGIPVTLQTRANATEPWAYVGRYLAHTIPIQGTITAVGTRQYRFYVPIQKNFPPPGDNEDGGTVTAPASSSVRTVTTQADFVTAQFDKSTAQVGEMVTASVYVRPAGTDTAACSTRRPGLAHVDVHPAVQRGRQASFKAAGRGTTRNWRITTPQLTYNGQPIVATISKALLIHRSLTCYRTVTQRAF